MYITFRIFPIRNGNPDPFHASIPGHVAVALFPFTFLEQGNDVRAAHFMQRCEIFIPRAMVQGKLSLPNVDELDPQRVIHLSIYGLCANI